MSSSIMNTLDIASTMVMMFCAVLWTMSIIIGVTTIVGKAIMSKKTVSFSKKDLCVILCMILPIAPIVTFGIFFRFIYMSLTNNNFIDECIDIDD